IFCSLQKLCQKPRAVATGSTGLVEARRFNDPVATARGSDAVSRCALIDAARYYSSSPHLVNQQPLLNCYIFSHQDSETTSMKKLFLTKPARRFWQLLLLAGLLASVTGAFAQPATQT